MGGAPTSQEGVVGPGSGVFGELVECVACAPAECAGRLRPLACDLTWREIAEIE